MKTSNYTALDLATEIDSLRAQLAERNKTLEHVSTLLGKVREGQYQWPYGVSWVVNRCYELIETSKENP